MLMHCFNPHSPLLANEFWRYQVRDHDHHSFNPHSPLLANELSGALAQAWGQGVSIHIRHYWRMNFGQTIVDAWHPGRFNPHSPLLANELSSTPSAWAVRAMFQSTFAITGE